jgi:hypothetical protein
VQILFVPPKDTKEFVMLDDEEAKQSQASFKIATSEQVIISYFYDQIISHYDTITFI